MESISSLLPARCWGRDSLCGAMGSSHAIGHVVVLLAAVPCCLHTWLCSPSFHTASSGVGRMHVTRLDPQHAHGDPSEGPADTEEEAADPSINAILVAAVPCPGKVTQGWHAVCTAAGCRSREVILLGLCRAEGCAGLVIPTAAFRCPPHAGGVHGRFRRA